MIATHLCDGTNSTNRTNLDTNRTNGTNLDINRANSTNSTNEDTNHKSGTNSTNGTSCTKNAAVDGYFISIHPIVLFPPFCVSS